jgi:hypothetical protein
LKLLSIARFDLVILQYALLQNLRNIMSGLVPLDELVLK